MYCYNASFSSEGVCVIFIMAKVAKFKSQLHVAEGEVYDLLQSTLDSRTRTTSYIIIKLDSKIVVDHFHSQNWVILLTIVSGLRIYFVQIGW